ncbi:hypothetical protein KW851_23600 [Pseudomonas sp. PDM33]|uniref:hypothetical protein n=1 Tax=unclassified Pseudomonas TaxID=196821 RepID=UPI0015A60DB9|nr:MULTISPECIES: hypothetical protein [unclassified Pseudomonas]MBV7585835.1 hypothetical protein [Pseudomonas sp. PDM33]
MLELLAMIFWSKLWFRLGIPVFSRQVTGHCTRVAMTPDELIERQPPSRFQPFLFERLSSRSIGFREWLLPGSLVALLNLSILNFYTPVMRGRLEIDSLGNVRIVGLLNYFPLLLGLYLLEFAIDSKGSAAPLIGLALLAAIYVVQRGRFKQLAAVLSSF